VGYTREPELLTSAFAHEATDAGMDIFISFDALNNVEAMRPAIDAVREVECWWKETDQDL
jgi:pyruvate carboxylase